MYTFVTMKIYVLIVLEIKYATYWAMTAPYLDLRLENLQWGPVI